MWRPQPSTLDNYMTIISMQRLCSVFPDVYLNICYRIFFFDTLYYSTVFLFKYRTFIAIFPNCNHIIGCTIRTKCSNHDRLRSNKITLPHCVSFRYRTLQDIMRLLLCLVAHFAFMNKKIKNKL